MRARLYVRVSTDEQAREGFSLQNQIDRCRAFADSQGWEITGAYVEDGKSAKNTNRPELARLRKEVVEGDVVLVYKLDRLTRSVKDLHVLLEEWDKRGAGFRSVTEIYDTTSAMGRLFINLAASMAQWERETIAERTYEGQRKQATTGLRPGAKAPYGYTLQEGKLVPDPQWAPVVQRIFRNYAQGQSIRAITTSLNNEGVSPKTARLWSTQTVNYILRQPLYAGNIAWGRVTSHGKQTKKRKQQDFLTFDGDHEPLIDEVTWRQVQATMERRKAVAPRVASSDYALTGFLRCSICGRSLIGHKSNSGRRYRCPTRFDKNGDCSMPYFPTDRVEAAFRSAASLHQDERYVKQWLEKLVSRRAETTGERKALEAERTDLQRKVDRWDSAFEEGEITAAERRGKVDPYQSRLSAIEDRLRELDAAPTIPSVREMVLRFADFSIAWDLATTAQRKELAHRFFASGELRPDGTVTLIPHELASVVV